MHTSIISEFSESANERQEAKTKVISGSILQFAVDDVQSEG